MARKYVDLRGKMSEEQKRRSAERAAAMLVAMDLAELRGALDVTQEQLADRLSVAQSNVSRLERRRDMLISTLRGVVTALGGELRITALFPDGEVDLVQFDAAGVPAGPTRS